MYVLVRLNDSGTAAKFKTTVLAEMPEVANHVTRMRKGNLFAAKGLDSEAAASIEQKSRDYGALEVKIYPETGSRQPKHTKPLPTLTAG